MTRKLTIRNDTAEQLAERQERGETAADVVRRLLRETAVQHAGGVHDSPPDSSRGGDRGEGIGPSPTDSQLETMAHSALTVSDVRQVERNEMSAIEYYREEYGLDPAEFDDAAALFKARQAEQHA